MPVEALLKSTWAAETPPGSGSPCSEDVRVPSARKTIWRRASEASNLTRSAAFTSSAASFGCLLDFGTARKEPPQLPPLPGALAMSHLPAALSPACPLMTPVIHAGQPIVAKVAFLKPAFHSSENDRRLLDSPAWIILTVRSKEIGRAHV